MKLCWFPKVLAVILISCCFRSVVLSKEVERDINLISSTSKKNSFGVFKKLGQRNDLVYRRQNSANVHCFTNKPNPIPTIKTFRPFNAKADAASLHQAMSGSGTTEQTIIDILTHRTYEQRNEIADVFNKEYGHESKFRVWLSGEVGGSF